jgi:antitoxin (DNA-binding transcriptional repressor) of toxin-antitoxin stability system
MEAIKVGIREFRADLAEYIASNTPVAVTRHGQTVGYFIPTKIPREADIAALRQAGATLDQMLAAKGVDIEAIATEFDAARKKPSLRKRPGSKVA